MTRAQYEKISRPFREKERLRQALIFTDSAITVLTYLAYPVLLCALLFQKDARLWRCFSVPFVSFLAVSGLRKLINEQRPYEKWNLPPVIPKEKHGESFPSRHVFSVFVIALAFYYTCLPLGIVLTVFGVLSAAVRVVGGVHYPHDVLAGAAIGILAGTLGFFVF